MYTPLQLQAYINETLSPKDTRGRVGDALRIARFVDGFWETRATPGEDRQEKYKKAKPPRVLMNRPQAQYQELTLQYTLSRNSIKKRIVPHQGM
ncbi:hypothetical protein NDU88_004466 [Pleurodeles waltl]|uniref:Uncharacterized protein n=1 Tax=Pleurodeles waltl TaxID=8319 RepID=A0AAV7V1A3_PLEWA|nr:hypothetical protein NDU88_004466 [Pleurodeles waltl]